MSPQNEHSLKRTRDEAERMGVKRQQLFAEAAKARLELEKSWPEWRAKCLS